MSSGDTSNPSGQNAIREGDIVIAVMGLTGAGKSSFINKAAGKQETVVGHDLTSETQAVQPVRCQRPNGRRNIILVDTPGFDDTHLSDSQTLAITANWLKETYQNNILLAGLLYLHDISDVRMAGTPLRHLTIFRDLCGDDNMKNIVLVTTKWDRVGGEGDQREHVLREKFWKDMISLGSRTYRFLGTYESAWEVINCLDLEGSHRKPLQIQKDLVDCDPPPQSEAMKRKPVSICSWVQIFIHVLTTAGENISIWVRSCG